TGNRAHADALLDRMRAVLDDAVLHAPALAAGMLEIQVAEVDARPEQGAEGALQRVGVEPGGRQQARFGDGKMGHGIVLACVFRHPEMSWRCAESTSGGAHPGGSAGCSGFCRACGPSRSIASTFGDAHGPVTR